MDRRPVVRPATRPMLAFASLDWARLHALQDSRSLPPLLFRRLALLQRIYDATVSKHVKHAATAPAAPAAGSVDADLSKDVQNNVGYASAARSVGSSTSAGDDIAQQATNATKKKVPSRRKKTKSDKKRRGKVDGSKRGFLTEDDWRLFVADCIRYCPGVFETPPAEFGWTSTSLTMTTTTKTTTTTTNQCHGIETTAISTDWANCYASSWARFALRSEAVPVPCAGPVRGNSKWTSITEGPCGEMVRFVSSENPAKEQEKSKTSATLTVVKNIDDVERSCSPSSPGQDPKTTARSTMLAAARVDSKNFHFDHVIDFADIIDAWHDAYSDLRQQGHLQRSQETIQYSSGSTSRRLHVELLLHLLFGVAPTEEFGEQNLLVRCNRCHSRQAHRRAVPSLIITDTSVAGTNIVKLPARFIARNDGSGQDSGGDRTRILPQVSMLIDNSETGDAKGEAPSVRDESSDPTSSSQIIESAQKSDAPISICTPIPDIIVESKQSGSQDVRILEQVANTQTTGSKVWSGALGLLGYLRKHEARRWRDKRHTSGQKNMTCIELGAGTGVLGIGCAAMGMVDRVVLTDVACGMNLLTKNAEGNSVLDNSRRCRIVGDCEVVVREFDWHDQHALSALVEEFCPPALVVGSDVVYAMDAVQPLCDALWRLCTSITTCFIALEVRDAFVFDAWRERIALTFTVRRIQKNKLPIEHGEFVHVYSLRKKSINDAEGWHD